MALLLLSLLLNISLPFPTRDMSNNNCTHPHELILKGHQALDRVHPATIYQAFRLEDKRECRYQPSDSSFDRRQRLALSALGPIRSSSLFYIYISPRPPLNWFTTHRKGPPGKNSCRRSIAHILSHRCYIWAMSAPEWCSAFPLFFL